MTEEEIINARKEAARLLGAIKTQKKAQTSKENGKLGGRPKKYRTIIIDEAQQ